MLSPRARSFLSPVAAVGIYDFDAMPDAQESDIFYHV